MPQSAGVESPSSTSTPVSQLVKDVFDPLIVELKGSVSDTERRIRNCNHSDNHEKALVTSYNRELKSGDLTVDTCTCTCSSCA